MIFLYSGTPGSGKSLHMAKDLVESFSADRPIVGNFPLNLEKLNSASIIKRQNKCGYYYLDNNDLSPKLLVEFSNKVFMPKTEGGLGHKYKEGHILLVIDECQLIFNSRDFQRMDRMQWLEFFTQHRKLGYDVILVSQFDRMIDRQIRSLIETEFNHRKVTSFGKIGKFLPNAKNTFAVIEYYYPLNERISASFFLKQKKYYSVYDTNFCFSSEKNGNHGEWQHLDQDCRKGLGVPFGGLFQKLHTLITDFNPSREEILYLQGVMTYGR